MKLPHALMFFVAVSPVTACLWDRDTIAMEARGRLEVVETALGWFDRFPPEYYQMRLDRVAPEITADPSRLDLYDDAAVACDRLGRHEEAVAWMEKKKAALQPLPQAQTAEHRYRLHANLGVFHTHRWIKSPERALRHEILDLAIQEVRIALQINPNAHFGREHAHLLLLEWWRAGFTAKPESDKEPDDREMPMEALVQFEELWEKSPSTDFSKGFCGLIQMGSAQDSPDVHLLLTRHLMMSHAATTDNTGPLSSLGYLLCLRLAELSIEERAPVHVSGQLQRWMQPGTHLAANWKKMDDSTAVNLLAHALSRNLVMYATEHDLKPAAAWFHETRRVAKQRHEAKTVFM
ncbi:MAG: hypothetical protein JNG86_19275, partial [Verrucomicrobiaceae bacterium]|nr:hypothetical protein [Verrucomicrobiaceae bacterium]